MTQPLAGPARRRPDGRTVVRAGGVAGLGQGLRRRAGAAGRQGQPRRRRARPGPGADRAEARRRRSTPCTANGARTAASRACWRPWPSPTPTPACWPRPWPWTRTSPRRCWRRRASWCPAAACSTASRWRAATSSRRPMWSSPTPRARRSASILVLRGRQRARRASWRATSWTYGEQVMVEPYIAGKELARRGARREGRAARPDRHRHHRRPRASMTTRPNTRRAAPSTCCRPRLPPHVFEAALRQAELAHAALGCRGVTRSDFRYDDIKDDLVLLEVNTQPGMTPTSLVPEQAAHVGNGLRRPGPVDGGGRLMPAVVRGGRRQSSSHVRNARGPEADGAAARRATRRPIARQAGGHRQRWTCRPRAVVIAIAAGVARAGRASWPPARGPSASAPASASGVGRPGRRHRASSWTRSTSRAPRPRPRRPSSARCRPGRRTSR